MKQLLVPILRGTIEYVRFTDEALLQFCKQMAKPTDLDSLDKYKDPCNALYCVPEVTGWLVNNKLASGFVLIGLDSDAWIFTKPECV
jgi:hypothetical protein